MLLSIKKVLEGAEKVFSTAAIGCKSSPGLDFGLCRDTSGSNNARVMVCLASPTRPPGERQNVSERVKFRARLAGGRSTCRAAAVHDIPMI